MIFVVFEMSRTDFCQWKISFWNGGLLFGGWRLALLKNWFCRLWLNQINWGINKVFKISQQKAEKNNKTFRFSAPCHTVQTATDFTFILVLSYVYKIGAQVQKDKKSWKKFHLLILIPWCLLQNLLYFWKQNKLFKAWVCMIYYSFSTFLLKMMP